MYTKSYEKIHNPLIMENFLKIVVKSQNNFARKGNKIALSSYHNP